MNQEFYDALAAQMDFFRRLHDKEMRRIESDCASEPAPARPEPKPVGKRTKRLLADRISPL